LPMMVFAMTMLVITSPIALLFLVPGLSAKTYLGIEITRSLVNMPIIVVMTMAESPLAMSILPRDRFGQFCAAQSMLRMIFAGILGSLLAGWLMRVLEHHCGAYALRFCFVWSVGFQALAMVCYYQLYRLWKKLGGGEHFHPPDSRGPAASVSTATHKGDCWRK